MADQTRSCPYCGETILAVARKCKHCGEFLDGSSSASSPSIHMGTCQEMVLWMGSPSHYYYLPAYIIGGLLIVAFGLGLIVIVWALLDRYSKVFTLTNRRVMSKSGILARTTIEVTMKDIRGIYLKMNVIERMFGLGTVEVGSAATGGVEVSFIGIPKAENVKEWISTLKRQAE